ncbi:SDR family oxidoreductase [soil metagenome]
MDSMSIIVTGATGHLGRLIVESLLRNGTPAGEIVAAGRNTGVLDDLKARGVRVARIDYDEPSTLDGVTSSGDVVMLVSGSEPGRRVPQHSAVIDAAKTAGAARIVYTSATNARNTSLVLAPEHKATEEYLEASGVPFTVLRNNWYNENYEGTVAQARQTGTVVTSTGDGRVASASRSDYAEAAAVVLASEGHEGKVYELGGDTAWNFAELAALLGAAFENVAPEEHLAILTGAGLDEGTAGFVVALDGNIREGVLGTPTGDLSRLIGRPTTTIAEYVATI